MTTRKLGALTATTVFFAATSFLQADPLVLLPNGGFETVFVNSSTSAPGFSPTGPVPPAAESALPGWTSTPEGNVAPWQTTASDGLIEIWESGFLGVNASTGVDLFNGGNHFAELNANEISTLFQDVAISTIGDVGYFFLHRGRNDTESLKLTITFLPTSTVVFSDDFSAGTAAWVANSDLSAFEITSAAQFGTYRFAFESLETGKPLEGNFIDNAAFGVVPEPSTCILLGLAGMGFVIFRRRARMAA